METIDLFSLRTHFNRNRILLCFNGPISRSLIEEIGNALKNYLQAENAQPTAAMDVFSIYIEMTQNIRHYAQSRGYGEQDSAATVIVARDAEERYLVQAGNLVEIADGAALLARVEALASMDKAQLKATYKTQLRQPRDAAATTGAGLGLIDVARKSSLPLKGSLSPFDEKRAFFSLCAFI
ncbi:MAG: biofilm regulation protein kinase SiaB [Propionivibrio sp.]